MPVAHCWKLLGLIWVQILSSYRFKLLIKVRSIKNPVFDISGNCWISLFSCWKSTSKRVSPVSTFYFKLEDIHEKATISTEWEVLCTLGLHRCWWRIMETKWVDDNLKIMLTALSIMVTNIHYSLKLPLGTNNVGSTFKRCHQHQNSMPRIHKSSPTLSE